MVQIYQIDLVSWIWFDLVRWIWFDLVNWIWSSWLVETSDAADLCLAVTRVEPPVSSHLI